MGQATREFVELLTGFKDHEWLDIQIQGNAARSNAASDQLIAPPLPPESVQLAFNGTSGAANLHNGFKIYCQIKSQIYEWMETFSPSTQVLDFGCGWGRIARFFLKDVFTENLYGVDISPLGIDACKSTLPGHYELIDREPPLKFSENTFGIVYAWSVFSHLPEDLHLQWLEEIRRILKPGGLLIASTLPRSFLVESRRLKDKGVFDHPWQKAAAASFLDHEVAMAGFEQGLFLFSPIPEAEYGMAIIPRAYVERRWASMFDFCDFIAEPEALGQSLIVVKKPDARGGKFASELGHSGPEM